MANFLYVECECRRCATDGTFATRRASGAPVITDAALALRLLLSARMEWNDATRGAYRAQRREDESP